MLKMMRITFTVVSDFVSENIELENVAELDEKFSELFFVPAFWDLTDKHLDCIPVRLFAFDFSSDTP